MGILTHQDLSDYLKRFLPEGSVIPSVFDEFEPKKNPQTGLSLADFIELLSQDGSGGSSKTSSKMHEVFHNRVIRF